MSTLHDALKALSPRDFADDVPTTDHDVAAFLKTTFEAAELAVNSLPQPPPPPTTPPTPATSANIAPARTAADVLPSPARLHPIHPGLEALRSGWGKPLKLGKENQPGVTMYKMTAYDRNGAWFARRSVHEGLGFEKWKRAMRREFLESLAVSGGPGAGSIRGIGAERRLERRAVEGVGTMEVYQLSAQFPGPTAPRDFVTLLLTTDSGLTDHSAQHRDDEKMDGLVPRHYMVVSIPVDHMEAPIRTGLVRGQYESIEMIREVPSPKHEAGNGETGPAMNPVEWIMITRSDPGGGIPRFMVERGTPSSIAGDAVKFLDWATGKDDFSSDDEGEETEKSVENAALVPDKALTLNRQPSSISARSRRLSDNSTFEPSQPTDTGIISSLTTVVRNGLDSYAPEALQPHLPKLIQHSQAGQDDYDDDSTETSSMDSFASAEQFTTAPDGLSPSLRSGIDSASSSSIPIPTPSPQPSTTTTTTAAAADDAQKRLAKETAKLQSRRRHLEARFARETARASAATSKDNNSGSKDGDKAVARLERDAHKREAKLARDLRKLDARSAAEHAKAASRTRKAAAADAVSRMGRERDQARRVAEVLRQERDVWRDRVGELQRENTMLVARVGRLGEGGRDLLRVVREDLARRGRMVLLGREGRGGVRWGVDGVDGVRRVVRVGPRRSWGLRLRGGVRLRVRGLLCRCLCLWLGGRLLSG